VQVLRDEGARKTLSGSMADGSGDMPTQLDDAGRPLVERAVLEAPQAVLDEICLFDETTGDLALGVARAGPGTGCSGLIDPPDNCHFGVDIGEVIMTRLLGQRVYNSLTTDFQLALLNRLEEADGQIKFFVYQCFSILHKW
jgi:hypothetical protein